MYTQIPRNAWGPELKAFSDRNASRLTVLEIDAPDLGAQQEEVDYPLRGVAYDPRDDRIEIMLGDLGRPSPHLTHTVGQVVAVELLSDQAGIDRVLRIAYEDGQVLLRMRPD